MGSLTATLFLTAFAACAILGLIRPVWALVGYMGIYMIAPDNTWWGKKSHTLIYAIHSSWPDASPSAC